MTTVVDSSPFPEEPLIAGRFRLQQQIGIGGMAEVFLAIDEHTQTSCALKLLSRHEDPELRRRFEQESAVLLQIEHPGIVRYHAHGYTSAGIPFLAMERLEGEDLGQRLGRKPLTIAETISVGKAVLSALHAAHQAGLVHRDIKPANLFLVGEQPARTKLLDFGIARRTDATQQTRTGSILGTPEYMSPEQLRGLRNIDARSDLFSVGVVLFECLMGWSPFHSDQPMGSLGKILFEDPPKLSERRPDLPPALSQLIESLLAKEPQHRPASADAARALLDAISIDSDREAVAAVSHPRALTLSELRWMSMIVVQPNRRELALEETSILSPFGDEPDTIAKTAAAFSARHERLLDGTQILLLEGTATAAEQAEQAALCAIELHTQAPNTAIAICFGQTDLAHHRLDAQSLERAAEMLDSFAVRAAAKGNDAAQTAAPILVDESLRRMLKSRFEFVQTDGFWVLLLGERPKEQLVLGRVSPFAGRDTELMQLSTALTTCLEESQAVAVLLTADPGMGKSRLGHEFLRKAKLAIPDLEVWIGSGDPSSAGSPFQLIASALRHAVSITQSMPPAEQTERLQRFVQTHCAASHRERIGGFLGELLGVSYQQHASDPIVAARGNPVLMGDQIRFAFLDLLGAIFAEHPLLLVLEDLHWGDLPTVQLLDAALRTHTDAPFMILALARPHIQDLFPKLWDKSRILKIPLKPLSARACEKIVKGIVGHRISAESLAALAERSGGHPFFLEELMRATSESDTQELPESVLSMVQSRILRLDPVARRVLRAASVYGRVFHRGGLPKMLGLTSTTEGQAFAAQPLDAALSVLVEREFVTPRQPSRFAGEAEFLFTHALIQESAYAMLTAEDRLRGHRLAAEFLREVGEHDALVLAEHFARGGVHDLAVVFLQQVVSEALTGNDFRAALEYVGRALKLGAEGTVRGTLLAMQAEALQWLAEFRAAIDSAELALSLLPAGSPAWYRAVDAIAIGSGRLLLHDRLSALGRQLSELLDSRKDPERFSLPLLASSTMRLGMQLYIAGRYQEALALLERMETLVADDPNPKPPALLAYVYALRANRAAFEWKIDLCPDYFEQSADLLDQVGDRRAACSQRLDTALFCSDIADFARMERLLHQVIPVASALGLARILGVSRSALGIALWRQGRSEQALPICEQALSQLESLGDARQEGVCRINLARILFSLGRIDEAYEAAVVACDKLAGMPRFQLRALSWLARIELQRGHLDEALQAAEQSLALLRKLGRAGTDEGLVYQTLAAIKHQLGQDDSARELLREGQARLFKQAAAITRSEVRHDYLNKLSENAELLALARTLNVQDLSA